MTKVNVGISTDMTMWGSIPITVHFLEVTSEKELTTKKSEVSSIRIYQVLKPDPRFTQWLYRKVGSNWYWIDRYFWSLEQWKSRFDDPRVRLLVMEIESHGCAQIAGYYELENGANEDTEISYFGLMDHAIGKGLGAHMLSDSLQRAFTLGANRVWLHTCSLDHPNALINYEARGMRVYKTVQDTQLIPPGWPYSTTRD